MYICNTCILYSTVHVNIFTNVLCFILLFYKHTECVFRGVINIYLTHLKAPIARNNTWMNLCSNHYFPTGWSLRLTEPCLPLPRLSSVGTVTEGSTARRNRPHTSLASVPPASTVNLASTDPIQTMLRPTAPTHQPAHCLVDIQVHLLWTNGLVFLY